MKTKKIAILGATGSIGTQTLQVCAEHPDCFEPLVLTANNQVDLLIAQSRRFLPDAVVIANEAHYERLRDALSDLPIKVYAGDKAIAEVVTSSEVDIVVTAMVGFAGLLPTIAAIQAGKTIALANKETLVVAGAYIQGLARTYNANILPVDSEHSAIFQCLQGAQPAAVEKILLTASGGPFRTSTSHELQHVTLAQALHHPKWQMGDKITIDSATMMNKGLEVIEAHWLFGVAPTQIQVVVHPESIIHSAVQFHDGCIIAQLGAPDMQLPIQYALTYPQRLTHAGTRINLFELQQLTFEAPDTDRFPCLALAYEALAQGGNMPCALNAANEVANEAFRKEHIRFIDIAQTITHVMQRITHTHEATLQTYLDSDEQARILATDYIQRSIH